MKKKLLLKKKQQGLTILELIIALAAVTILSGVVAKGVNAFFVNRDAGIATEQIKQIYSGAQSMRRSDIGYSGVSISALVQRELLDVSYGTGVGVNPDNGDYTITASSNNTVTITATGLRTGVCMSLAQSSSESAVSATCSNGTVTIVYR